MGKTNSTESIRRGFHIPENSNILIVEDVITTGKSVLECSELIKNSKSKIVGFSCIIDRTNDTSLLKHNIVSQLKLEIETYKNSELPEELSKIEAVKPGSRNLSK